MTNPTPTEIEAIADGLTKARKRAIRYCNPGWLDDDSLRGGERKMLYSLIEHGLLEHRSDPRHPMLSIFCTNLGVAVRDHLMKQMG